MDEKVDFIFDNRMEKSFILAGWEDMVKVQDEEIQKHYGATPRFEDDQEFLPLQAADLWAWWVREWYEDDDAPMPELPRKMKVLDFGKWNGKKRNIIAFSWNEDQLFDLYQRLLENSFDQGSFYKFPDV